MGQSWSFFSFLCVLLVIREKYSVLPANCFTPLSHFSYQSFRQILKKRLESGRKVLNCFVESVRGISVGHVFCLFL